MLAQAQAMSRFVKGNGANNNKKDYLPLSSDDEDDNRSRNVSLLCSVTPEQESKPTAAAPSPNYDRTPSALVELVVEGDSKDDDVSPPMPFSDTPDKAKAATRPKGR
jgi:hypothetical protein